jgi:hypothetical protein
LAPFSFNSLSVFPSSLTIPKNSKPSQAPFFTSPPKRRNINRSFNVYSQDDSLFIITRGSAETADYDTDADVDEVSPRIKAISITVFSWPPTGSGLRLNPS